MLHIYTGEGKGKTTAAMGLALRAIGHGRKVVILQFLKSGTSGELIPLEELGATVIAGKAGCKFVSAMTREEKQETRKMHDENLRKALGMTFDLLVLDEACAALKYDLVDPNLIGQTISLKSEREIVLTGRDPAQFLLDEADYITDMVCVRHPYERGTTAREGIEY
jgi:cob(I)alamin adenosyltransferase